MSKATTICLLGLAAAAATAAPNMGGEAAAYAKAAVRHRLASLRQLDGWFVEETYWNNAPEARLRPVVSSVAHIFYWGNRSGWLADQLTRRAGSAEADYLRAARDGLMYREWTAGADGTVWTSPDGPPGPPIVATLDWDPSGGGATDASRLLACEIDDVTRERLGAWEVDRVSGRSPATGARWQWWLAPGGGFYAVKARLATTRHEKGGVVEERYARAAMDLTEIAPGVWLPRRILETPSWQVAGKPWVWGNVTRVTVLEAHANRDDSSLPFQMIAPPGTRIAGQTPVAYVGGDISPFLERLAAGPDRDLLAFAKEHAAP
jgi:hypothetical protein